MNDPFKELAEQSHFNMYLSPMWNSTGQRFANRLIAECIQVIKDAETTPQGFTQAKSSSILEYEIKKHFGIVK